MLKDRERDELREQSKELKPLKTRMQMISVENREKASFTGVTDVESFNEDEVVLVSEMGVLVLTGQQMHISRLNLDDGQLVVEGRLNAVEYLDSDRPVKKGWFGKK